MLPDVRNFDSAFITAAGSGSATEVLKTMRTNLDAFRICGFPPLYLMLKSLPGLTGECVSYAVWDEKERESAVSYSGVLFREK
jgi:hypothetical protein